ncbi:MAG: hypothetical protein FJ297_09415 [Planctomycetes bacterium]|nr:hypothetical protein [Planctomycetota bacterium]
MPCSEFFARMNRVRRGGVRIAFVATALWLAARARVPFAQDLTDFGVEIPMSSGFVEAPYGLEDEFSRTGRYPSSKHRGWAKSYGLAAGAEMTWLSADLNGTPPALTFSDVSLPSAVDFGADAADVGSFRPGARIWIGAQGATWGLVGRYWRFHHGAFHYDPATDFGSGSGSVLPAAAAIQRVDAYTLDLEVTRSWHPEVGRLEGGLGVRFASIDHDASIWAANTIGGDEPSGLAGLFREYRGTGITSGARGTQPFLGMQSVEWFWSGRTSALWGTARSRADAMTRIATPTGTLDDTGGASAESDRAMFLGELQLGLQYSQRLACPASAFFRVTGEYQAWLALGDELLATASAADPGIAVLSATAAGGPIEAHLVGLSIGAGLLW